MANHPILNPELPYVGEVEGGLTSGKMLRVQGRVPVDSNFFAINFQLGPKLDPRDDIALHVSPRFKEGIIFRNHIQSMAWGPEESSGPMPIQRGSPFEIIILCNYHCYKIAVNGKHFAEFAHRLPYGKVTHLVIDGEVEINSISYEMIPTPKPTAPIPDITVDVGPPAPGGLYPTLSPREKLPNSDVSGDNPRDYNYYPSKPQNTPEKPHSGSGIDKVGLAVGGLVAAGSIAAALHAHKKNKKRYESEGDHYQGIKSPKHKSGMGGLGVLGTALASGLASNALASMASNAFQNGMKSPSKQGYPSPNARSDVFSSILGGLGGGNLGGPQSNYSQQPNYGHHQQPYYPSSGGYGGYPGQDSSQSGGNPLSDVLFKSALGGLSSHMSDQVEKKLAKQLTKGLSKAFLTPKKA